jgi:hypothetical protein
MTPERIRELIKQRRDTCVPATEADALLVEQYYSEYCYAAQAYEELEIFRVLCVVAETHAILVDESGCLVTIDPPAGSSDTRRARTRRLAWRLGHLLQRRAIEAGEEPDSVRARRERAMTSRIVDATFDGIQPIGDIGRMLVERYGSLLRERNLSMEERTTVLELRQLVESNNLTGDPAQISRLLAPRAGDRPWRIAIRRQLEGRLIRILEAEGALAPPEDRRARDRTAQIIVTAPPKSQRMLKHWAQWRAATVAPLAVKDEITRLVELERLIDERGGEAHTGLLTLWLRRLTRRVVNCTCHPLWNCFDADECRRCGATAEQFGTKPSIGELRMRRYRTEGARYLEFRRSGARTRLFA